MKASGLLSHANPYELSTALKNAYWVRGETGEIPTHENE